MKFNTAHCRDDVAGQRVLRQGQALRRGELSVLMQLLNPVAPHITEEINALSGCVCRAS